MTHEKPPIDFLKKAREKGKKISRENLKGKDLERDLYKEKDQMGKISDLDIERMQRRDDANQFDALKEFENIGVKYFREIISKFKNKEKGYIYNEIALRKFRTNVRRYSDRVLLDIYESTQEDHWGRDVSMEYYRAVFDEVIKRFANR
jgi:hypothetical protein